MLLSGGLTFRVRLILLIRPELWETLGMARVAVRLVVAALLALISAQAGVPLRAVAAYEYVESAEQRTHRVLLRRRFAIQFRPVFRNIVLVFRTDILRILLFQLPPPLPC